ncbi:MAG: hypothetical protein ACM338_10190 [Betaproteobacteria bacterium]|mgnify:CR=1 FL=1
MNGALVLFGRAVGAIGVAICVLASAARITGHYTLGSYQAGTLLLAGTASMVAGCLALLWAMSSRDRGGR